MVSPFVPVAASVAEMRYLWQCPHRLDNRKLQALIGPELHTVLGEAVRASLAELGWVTPKSDLRNSDL